MNSTGKAKLLSDLKPSGDVYQVYTTKLGWWGDI